MKFQYKKQKSYEDRIKYSFKLKDQYRDRIPVIIELGIDNSKAQEKKIPDKLCKIQIMAISKTIKVQQLWQQLKQQYQSFLSHKEALFIFFDGNKLLSSQYTSTLEDLYQNNQDNDGWLYLEIKIQETLG